MAARDGGWLGSRRWFVLLAAVVAVGARAELDLPDDVLPADPDEAVAPVEETAQAALVLAGELFKQLETESLERLWEPVNRLVRLARSHGAVITEKLQAGAVAPHENVRLACARALCQLNVTDKAAPALCALARKGTTPAIRRQAASVLALTESLQQSDEVTRELSAALKSETDQLTRVALAQALMAVKPQSEGRDALLTVLLEGAGKDLKDAAALALAEGGALHLSVVRQRLLDLHNEPTPHGELARQLLRGAEDGGRTRDTKVSKGEQLVRELLAKVKAGYPDETKVDPEKLFESAAKGLVGALDPYSQYMDRQDVRQTQEMLRQDYGGIGAYVGLRNGSFVVTSPIYGAPADRAGLRAMDVIQEVDGEKAVELLDKAGVNAVIAKLKGKPGTPVKVKYWRRSFQKPIEVTITREQIRVDTVLSGMLPGSIGYIRLTRFGERTASELSAALEQLLHQQHAKALILDLRDNPGGLLRSGVEVADKFLAANKLIVYSEGNKEFAPRKDYYATGTAEDEAFPMVALVGPGSASASEIVAGALQDHKRALLVGEKTFGKGSVQQIMPLQATGRQTQLRLTVARYFLPAGRCIHEKGIAVDVEVKRPDVAASVLEGLEDLRRHGACSEFVERTWDANKELYARLAHCDEGRCEHWPGFDDFYRKLTTRLDRSDVRAELRTVARRRLQDDQKKELAFDIQEDVVLEQGILETLKKLKVDPQTIAEYKLLPERLRKKDDVAQEGAMLAPQARAQ